MRDGSATRRKIDEAALSLFVEKGIAGTSVRDIARAVGIAEGALYRHYASKEELARRLFAENYLALAEAAETVQRGERGFRAKLEALIRHFCRAFDENPTLFAYLLLSQHEQVRKVTATMKSPMAVVRRVVTEGLAQQPTDKRNPEVVAAMLMGVVLQVAVERLYGRIEGSLSSLADGLAAACWRVAKA
jgi:AcrR family transcriptional regulator